MNALVTFINHRLVTTSRVFAEQTGYAHTRIINKIRKYQTDLEAFWPVEFQHTTALLTKDQATMCLGFLSNTLKNREFKKALIKAFLIAEKTLIDQARAQLRQNLLITARGKLKIEPISTKGVQL